MTARQRCRRLIVTIIFGVFSVTAGAEVYSANVAIVDGDLVRAREDAIREVLRDVGLAGDVELRSTTAMVNQELVQSSLLTSRVRLKEFSVSEEEIIGNRLRLAVRVEKELVPPSRCEPVVSVRNIDAVWQIAASTMISGELRQAVLLFFSGLRESLSIVYPALLPTADVAPKAAYHLRATVAPQDGQGGHVLALDILGADGSTIKTFSYALELGTLMARRRESLGYANLTRWVLTPEASAQIAGIAQDVSAALRCLPVVVRLAENGSLAKIDTVAGQKMTTPSLVFYSDAFPVKAGGDVDLLALRGALTVSHSDDAHLYLELPKRMTGRPYPSPGHFLWLQ